MRPPYPLRTQLTDTNPSMCAARAKSTYATYGVQCEEGWRSLIEPLLRQCEQEGVAVEQVKQKLGGLRFYIQQSRGSAELRDAIAQAEEKSYSVCERCGAPGVLRRTEFLQTLCDTHNQERSAGAQTPD